MKEIVRRSIKQLNDLLPKEKKLEIKDATILVGEKSNLESIDLVNLFVNLEKNLKEEKKLTLTFDEIIQNIDQLKTIGALTVFLNNKLKKNEKK
tara:strand:+ start:454 stop:735 length:282 start_codon:yes stop_codon:yes gene_type:complete